MCIYFCPDCHAEAAAYGSTTRLVRTKYKKSYKIRVKRIKCSKCHKIHRILPDLVLPYCRYEKEVMIGVVNGWISSDILGFEDYPCEPTMLTWKVKYSYLLEK